MLELAKKMAEIRESLGLIKEYLMDFDIAGVIDPELLLDNNQLRSLPESLASLTNLRHLSLEKNPLNAMLSVLWLAQTHSTFLKWVPSSLFNHPLVEPLEPESLKPFGNNSCPFCGAYDLVTGYEKKTGKKQIFCSICENTIEA